MTRMIRSITIYSVLITTVPLSCMYATWSGGQLTPRFTQTTKVINQYQLNNMTQEKSDDKDIQQKQIRPIDKNVIIVKAHNGTKY